MKIRLLLLSLTLWMTGCFSTYKAPASGPTALVKVPSDVMNLGSLFVFDNAQCANVRLARIDAEGTIALPAGRPVFIGSKRDTRGLAVEVYCKSLVSFVPQPNAVYETNFSVDFNSRRCALEVKQLLPSGSQQREPSLRPFHHKDCDSFWTQP